MYTKSSFLASLKAESKIVKHLASQVPAGGLDYRPSPAQRSTLELLRYLAILPTVATINAITGTWDHWEQYESAASKLGAAEIPKALDRQLKAVTKILAKLGDAQLKRKKAKTWGGQTCTLGEALVESVIKSAAAYRMQLFLYVKASGAGHLGTSDVWAGKPAKVTKAKATKAKAAQA